MRNSQLRICIRGTYRRVRLPRGSLYGRYPIAIFHGELFESNPYGFISYLLLVMLFEIDGYILGLLVCCSYNSKHIIILQEMKFPKFYTKMSIYTLIYIYIWQFSNRHWNYQCRFLISWSDHNQKLALTNVKVIQRLNGEKK